MRRKDAASSASVGSYACKELIRFDSFIQFNHWRLNGIGDSSQKKDRKDLVHQSLVRRLGLIGRLSRIADCGPGDAFA